MSDFLVRGSLEEIDPAVYELIQLEAERQYRKLILIPSESTAPFPFVKRWVLRFRIFTLKDIRMKNYAG